METELEVARLPKEEGAPVHVAEPFSKEDGTLCSL